MRCPRCGSPDLDPNRHDATGMVTCRCGLRAYAGYLAESAALSARLAWLADRITAGDPAPEPRLAARYGVWGLPGTAPAPGSRPGGPARQASSAQTVLLGVGALLLVVAAAVFAAVVWDRIGAVGQVALMVGGTLGVGALAVRIRTRLPGTAEALAVVAAGLGAIDLLAAPALGLLPERWVADPTLYPALALAGLGGVLIGLGGRFGLRAWTWLGWSALPVAALVVPPAVEHATGSAAWTAAALAVPALAGVALLAASGRPGHGGSRAPLLVAGLLGVAASGVVTAAAAMHRPALPGALLTTTLTAAALVLWGSRERPDHGPHPLAAARTLAAAALGGAAVGMALAVPADPQPVWLALFAALAGLAVGLVVLVTTGDRGLAMVGAAGAWSVWAWLRLTGAELPGPDAVQAQLSLLAALVSAMAFVVAWWIPWTGWLGALLALVAMALGWQPDVVEAFTLPLAGLLLGAGLLWRRQRPGPSLGWLGPAVAAALIPSAVLAWTAPWVWGGSGTTAEHLARLGWVLAAGVATVVLGARTRLGGLLVPGAVALVIVALGQLSSGLSNLPRWLGLGIAGTLLIIAGARVEALARGGRRAAGWVGSLH